MNLLSGNARRECPLFVKMGATTGRRYIRIERTLFFKRGKRKCAGIVLHSATLNGKQVSSNSLPTKLFYRTNLSYLFFFHSFIQRYRTSVGNAHANARHKYNTFRIRSLSTRTLFQKIGPAIRQFRLSCLQRPLKRPVVMSPCCIVAFSLEAI